LTVDKQKNPSVGAVSKRVYIIAIDFDGCICKNGWPDASKGELISSTVNRMHEQLKKEPNTEFVLWTCRAGNDLESAKEFIVKHNLPIFIFNEPHPSVFPWMTGAEKCRKIFAHEYWDDRAVTVKEVEATSKTKLAQLLSVARGLYVLRDEPNTIDPYIWLAAQLLGINERLVNYDQRHMAKIKAQYDTIIALTEEQIKAVLNSCELDKETSLVDDLIKIKVLLMYRHEFEQLPEFNGC